MNLSTRQGEICVLQFDNARKLNSLSTQLIGGLMERMDRLPAEGCLVLVVPAQSGARVWSAGHDIRELAGRIAANARLAVRAIKAQFRLLTRGGLLDAETAEQIQQIRRQVYHNTDYAEGIRAFLEKRPPQFRGC